jgi:DNA-binding beta-propeller fold protein YncE
MEGEVKSMRRLLMALCGLVLVSGCAATEGKLPLASGDYRLYEAASTKSGQLVAVINSRSQTTERRLPRGTLSPDGKRLYAVTSNKLQEIDSHTGAVLRTLQIPGNFDAPPAGLGGVPGGLSQNGRWLALQTGGGQRTTSHMLLVDTSAFKVSTRIDLDGVFDFDAVSNDGQRVYVIEYTNATAGYYRVRVYEVGAGQLGPYTVVDKGDPNEPMTGARISGVFSPDGQWLYSVYARENQGAFVHALNLTQPFAFCLDLPGPGWSTSMNAFQWSLALTADGRHLYAANGALGLLAQIDTLDGSFPQVSRTGTIASTGPTSSLFAQDVAAKEFGPSGSALSQDGKTLVTAGQNGLLWIDTATLQTRNRQLAKWTVWSVAASPDGSRVYAVNDAGAIAELSMADGRVAATFDPGEGFPMGLLRVEPASS